MEDFVGLGVTALDQLRDEFASAAYGTNICKLPADVKKSTQRTVITAEGPVSGCVQDQTRIGQA